MHPEVCLLLLLWSARVFTVELLIYHTAEMPGNHHTLHPFLVL